MIDTVRVKNARQYKTLYKGSYIPGSRFIQKTVDQAEGLLTSNSCEDCREAIFIAKREGRKVVVRMSKMKDHTYEYHAVAVIDPESTIEDEVDEFLNEDK